MRSAYRPPQLMTLRARTGQTLTASLKSTHKANYFNVLPPGSQDAAIFIGSTSGHMP